jgi:hypothetical protein
MRISIGIYLTILFGILFFCECTPKKYQNAVISENRIYSEEVNFLKDMSMGDTVYIFIKESGYFFPNSRSSYSTRLTCYTRVEVSRIDTFLYKARKYFAVPGGPSQKGPDFEFDSVKSDLQKTLNATSSLELYCVNMNQTSLYLSGDSCLLRLCCGHKEIEKIRWNKFINLGMSDQSLQKWRFLYPNYEELQSWRTSVKMNSPTLDKRYEVLSFYKDTSKISFCTELPITYPYDFSRLK